MNVEPESTAVIVVDLQNTFTHPDGPIYTPGAADVVEPVNRLLEDANDAGASIVFVKDVHPEEQFENNYYYDEFERWGEHNLDGSWAAEISEGANTEVADRILEKHTYDAFHDTELDAWLTTRNIKDLVFVGGLANFCLLETASSAILRDYRPIVVKDCIGTIQDEVKETALERAEHLYGEICTSDELHFEV